MAIHTLRLLLATTRQTPALRRLATKAAHANSDILELYIIVA